MILSAKGALQRGGGAGDSPRGRLRSGAPEGVQLCWTVCQILSKSPNPRTATGRATGSHRWTLLVLLGFNLALSSSKLAVLSVMFVHLVQLGSYLAPPWPIFAPTWPNLAPTWPNLVPSWPNLAPTWSNMVPKSNQDELQELFSGVSKRCSVFY